MKAMPRRAIEAVLSTKPLRDQRPFWPAMFTAVGSLVANMQSSLLHQRQGPLTWIGLTIAVIGLGLTIRYFARQDVVPESASRR